MLAHIRNKKGTLLTTTVFLHCIDATKHHKEVVENLHALKHIDILREGYYNDLMTLWNIEQQLCMDYKKNDEILQFKIAFTEPISSIPHLQYYSYCEHVNLSNQNLTSKVLPSFKILQHCKKLSLENNKLTTLKNFPLLDLEELNLRGNNELLNGEIECFKGKVKYNVIY